MYFVLTFVISWGGILLTVGSTSGMARNAIPLGVILAMLAGPSLSGILLTGLISGRAGFRELLGRLLRWRVDARWYAVALLTSPILTAAVYFSLSLLSPEFLPRIVTTDDRGSLLLAGIVGGLVAGFFEELGWVGFATPRLRVRHGVLASGLIIGTLWGAWHFLTQVVAVDTVSGGVPVPVFLVGTLAGLLIGGLPSYRVFMGWVYERTESLLVAILMHASLSASTFFILVPEATGVPLLAGGAVLAAAQWVVVAAVIVAGARTAR
jgi:membrane protease YdiL (CAAX protease family)